MQDLQRMAKHSALQSLVRKMRNQDFDQNIRISAKPISNGGLNTELLHPDYLRNPLKQARIKLGRIFTKGI